MQSLFTLQSHFAISVCNGKKKLECKNRLRKAIAKSDSYNCQRLVFKRNSLLNREQLCFNEQPGLGKQFHFKKDSLKSNLTVEDLLKKEIVSSIFFLCVHTPKWNLILQKISGLAQIFYWLVNSKTLVNILHFPKSSHNSSLTVKHLF